MCLFQDFLANELQLQFEKLSNQARFVKMIVSKELVVSNRKKADIVEELRQKKFRPFPKVAKAKAAGETEGAEEGADDEADEATTGGGSTDYDYLLSMAIWSLTKERVRRAHALIRI
jgi:DNA topoisomerase-2